VPTDVRVRQKKSDCFFLTFYTNKHSNSTSILYQQHFNTLPTALQYCSRIARTGTSIQHTVIQNGTTVTSKRLGDSSRRWCQFQKFNSILYLGVEKAVDWVRQQIRNRRFVVFYHVKEIRWIHHRHRGVCRVTQSRRRTSGKGAYKDKRGTRVDRKRRKRRLGYPD
jgi:hypothetical protein